MGNLLDNTGVPTAIVEAFENSQGHLAQRLLIALQAGLDYALGDKWFLNLDLKQIFLQTDATVNATTALGATVGADVDINPLVIGFGFGMKF